MITPPHDPLSQDHLLPGDKAIVLNQMEGFSKTIDQYFIGYSIGITICHLRIP